MKERPAAIADFKPLPEGPDQYPLEFIEHNSVLKLREEEGRILVGICDPADEALRESLRNFHGKEVDFLPLERSDLAGFLGEQFSYGAGCGAGARRRPGSGARTAGWSWTGWPTTPRSSTG